MLALTPATLKLYATLSVIPTLLLSTLLSLTRDKKQGLDNEELLLFKQSREMKEWAKKTNPYPYFHRVRYTCLSTAFDNFLVWG